MNTQATRPHLGRKISRIRDLQNIKQGTVAIALGVKQQTVSKMEQRENIKEEKLEAVAKALGVSPETIKNFNEEVPFIVQNNYENAQNNVNYQINPIEKITELYERLLKSEQEKVTLLEQLLKKHGAL